MVYKVVSGAVGWRAELVGRGGLWPLVDLSEINLGEEQINNEIVDDEVKLMAEVQATNANLLVGLEINNINAAEVRMPDVFMYASVIACDKFTAEHICYSLIWNLCGLIFCFVNNVIFLNQPTSFSLKVLFDGMLSLNFLNLLINVPLVLIVIVVTSGGGAKIARQGYSSSTLQQVGGTKTIRLDNFMDVVCYIFGAHYSIVLGYPTTVRHKIDFVKNEISILRDDHVPAQALYAHAVTTEKNVSIIKVLWSEM